VIAGTSIGRFAAGPAKLDDLVICDADWQTLSAEVRGWVGADVAVLLVQIPGAKVWLMGEGSGPAWR
jgi:hypothetical protein